MAQRLPARLLRAVHRIEDGLLASTLALLVLIAFGQIIARLLFNTGWQWAGPTERLLILWLAMLGALAATRDNRHIAIDLLPRLLPPFWRRFAWGAGQLFAAVICALLAWGSVDLVLLEYESAGMAVANLPIWVSLLILPLGFSLMALRMLLAAFSAPPVDSDVA